MRTTGRMEGHIILSLRGFEAVAYGPMHCVQLQAAVMITKKWHGRPSRDTDRHRDIWTDIRTDRWVYGWTDVRTAGFMDIQTDGHISSTGTHWGPSEPSVGINSSRRWTHTLEINTNKKIVKGLWITGKTDGRMRYAQLRSAGMISKKRRRRPDRETERQRDRRTDRWADSHKERKTDGWMDGHICSTGPHWGPS